MKIETKFDIGDVVIEKNFPVTWTVKGIIVFDDGDIGYFSRYEDDFVLEQDLDLYQKGEKNDFKI